jgi:hypothetical protein
VTDNEYTQLTLFDTEQNQESDDADELRLNSELEWADAQEERLYRS